MVTATEVLRANLFRLFAGQKPFRRNWHWAASSSRKRKQVWSGGRERERVARRASPVTLWQGAPRHNRRAPWLLSGCQGRLVNLQPVSSVLTAHSPPAPPLLLLLLPLLLPLLDQRGILLTNTRLQSHTYTMDWRAVSGSGGQRRWSVADRQTVGAKQ